MQTELAFTLAKNATKPDTVEIISLQTTRKENNWKTEETLARTVVTLATERIKLVQSLMYIMMMMMMMKVMSIVQTVGHVVKNPKWTGTDRRRWPFLFRKEFTLTGKLIGLRACAPDTQRYEVSVI